MLDRVPGQSPGYVARGGGEATLDALRAYSAAYGGNGDLLKVSDFGAKPFGWHGDNWIGYSSDYAEFNAHRTAAGQALGAMVMPTRRFWQDVGNTIHYYESPLYRHVIELLTAGQVDDDYLEPIVYTAEVGPDDVLMMPFDGPWGHALHCVTTIGEAERFSTGWLGSVSARMVLADRR
ncbi:MAG TPA: hypothetical protein VLH84_00935 [Patescibacteria group bacterium]|nr:hypothetical protein [Patescibacteria group bacterium]